VSLAPPHPQHPQGRALLLLATKVGVRRGRGQRSAWDKVACFMVALFFFTSRRHHRHSAQRCCWHTLTLGRLSVHRPVGRGRHSGNGTRGTNASSRSSAAATSTKSRPFIHSLTASSLPLPPFLSCPTYYYYSSHRQAETETVCPSSSSSSSSSSFSSSVKTWQTAPTPARPATHSVRLRTPKIAWSFV